MKNKWSNLEAKKYISYYKKKNISKELALRIYTTHLLGREKDLVLHGGGNTSMKTTYKNIFSKNIDVMHIKGSGWDMGTIDHPGLPAVELDSLLKTKNLKKLDDFQMVNLQRKSLINSQSPNPSVETLLHAFLPYKYVDHTHSSAILGLIDQPNDIQICKNTFGQKVGIVPYIIPGFDLAKLSDEIFKQNDDVIGLILLKHGIFTFGNDAKQSYDRMINLVSIAEKKINSVKNKILNRKILNKKLSTNIINDLFPLIRKNLSIKEKDGTYTKWILDLRVNDKILKYLSHPNLKEYSSRGPVTPDHVIRTKSKPLILNLNNIKKENLNSFINKEIDKFKKDYHNYFLKNKRFVAKPIELDPNPRLIYIPNFGIIGIGRSKKEAKIASDLAEVTVDVISSAESLGRFKSIPAKEIFKVEYWPLEQAKLKTLKRASLTGNITVVSGGCGAIGLAIAKEFLLEGSEVILLENNFSNIDNAPDEIKKTATIINCDVTNQINVRKAFNQIKKLYGGVDILISNAGAAWKGEIGTVSDKTIKESFDLNFYAHQYLSQESIGIMKNQNTGGVLLYNISKQSINPGNNFGPYGLPKASTLFLMRQYTLEYGKYGIRANGVNADKIKSGILTKDMIASRAKARNLSQKDYMSGNLLKTEILAEDVARAFVYLAKAKKTTGDVITVDGGNIAAVLR